ncbi:MAG: hypothetical protein ABIW76_13975 [Fibrobacteria bacterium]
MKTLAGYRVKRWGTAPSPNLVKMSHARRIIESAAAGSPKVFRYCLWISLSGVVF